MAVAASAKRGARTSLLPLRQPVREWVRSMNMERDRSARIISPSCARAGALHPRSESSPEEEWTPQRPAGSSRDAAGSAISISTSVTPFRCSISTAPHRAPELTEYRHLRGPRAGHHRLGVRARRDFQRGAFTRYPEPHWPAALLATGADELETKVIPGLPEFPGTMRSEFREEVFGDERVTEIESSWGLPEVREHYGDALARGGWTVTDTSWGRADVEVEHATVAREGGVQPCGRLAAVQRRAEELETVEARRELLDDREDHAAAVRAEHDPPVFTALDAVAADLARRAAWRRRCRPWEQRTPGVARRTRGVHRSR